MRWERLFGDLEAQLDEAQQADLAAEVADRTRRELARLRLVDRLRAVGDRRLSLRVLGVGALTGRLVDSGADWLVVRDDASGEWLVSASAVSAVSGLGPWSLRPGEDGSVAGRLGLGSALRAVARDRRSVTVVLLDGGTLTGTVDRVGADFMDLVQHAPDEPRLREAGRVATVALSAVAALHWSPT